MDRNGSWLRKHSRNNGNFPCCSWILPGFIDQILELFANVFNFCCWRFYKKHSDNPFIPFIVGAVVLSIGISFGGMNGYAINPARDLGPRILLLFAGFKNHGFNNLSIVIVPIIGPIIGAILGATIYEFTLKNNKD